MYYYKNKVLFLLLFFLLINTLKGWAADVSDLSKHDDFNEHGQITHLRVIRPKTPTQTLEERNEFRKRGVLDNGKLTMIPLTPAHLDSFVTDLFENPIVMEWYEVGEVRTKEKHKESPREYVNRRGLAWLERWERSPFSWWAIHLKDNFIGGLGCMLTIEKGRGEIEIAYLLNNKYWHQGYATQALDLFLNYALTQTKLHGLPVDAFYAPVHPFNKLSINLLTKFCFTRDFTKDKIIEPLENKLNRYTYVLNKETYIAKRKDIDTKDSKDLIKEKGVVSSAKSVMPLITDTFS